MTPFGCMPGVRRGLAPAGGSRYDNLRAPRGCTATDGPDRVRMMQTNTCFTCGFENKGSGTTCHKCGTPMNLSGSSASGGAQAHGAGHDSLKLRRGQIVAKRYVVKDMVGRGGMGCIYRVHDNTLNEEVALKTLLPQYTQDKIVVDRFFNEARIARGLSHPNIVRVHDIGVTEQVAYISMELLAGKTLREILDSTPMKRPLPVDTILTIFEDLCSALEYAHRFTIHRDIKPENVMILEDGSVKLMDFGISKLMANPNLTSASMVMGTPHYMSPEQLRNSAGVDARSDIYSVGVMFYEMLTGHTPTGVPKPASEAGDEVPLSLDPIIEKCVEPNPAKRFPAASDLREAIRSARVSGQAQRERVSRAPTRRVRPWPHIPRRVITVVLVLAVVAGGAVGVQRAEQRRADLLASGASGSDVPTPQQTTTGDADIFSQMKSLENVVRQDALNAARRDIETRYAPWNERMRSRAAEFWGAALQAEATDPERASELGWGALVRYAAIAVRPEGMVFVPPTEVTYYINRISETKFVEAFFIDEREVTWGEFSEFCVTGVWRWPENAPRWEFAAPMTQVAFYDAQAYTASVGALRKLPTYPQLMAALDPEGTYPVAWWDAQGDESFDMDEELIDLDEVESKPSEHEVLYKWVGCSEWTRSVWGSSDPRTSMPVEDAGRIGFGAQLVIEQGEYGDGLHTAYAPGWLAYRQGSDRVGFRSVYELPTTVAGLRALVQGSP